MVGKVLTEDTGMRWNCVRYREKKMKKQHINELNSKLANQLILFLIREKLKERI